MILVTIALVLVIGLVDFLAGFELSLLVFYILPICAAVTVSWRFAIAAAVACIATWLVGDFAAGATFSKPGVLFWNALAALGTYLILIGMFHRVLVLQRDMELRVRQRTDALTRLLAERERLEKAILEISERERRSIGQDLHDGLGQHLTGTALAGQVLADKLQVKGLEEQEDAWRIVGLVEEGIEKSRLLARGLLLAEIERDGLIAALQDFAADAEEQFKIRCNFTCGRAIVRFTANDAATHLLRIAQEAVRNAVRHGKAKQVDIALEVADAVTLSIRDFGSGYVPHASHGLGLSIMAHRAEIIGGTFAIAPHPTSGTLVTCRLPLNCLRP
jgi:signal transduction histidine kinase